MDFFSFTMVPAPISDDCLAVARIFDYRFTGRKVGTPENTFSEQLRPAMPGYRSSLF